MGVLAALLGLLLWPLWILVLLVGWHLLELFQKWRRERRYHRAMFAFRLLPEERRVKARITVTMAALVEPPRRQSVVCRRSECIALYLDGELSSWSQERFEDHCRFCVYCKKELARCSQIRARDEVCTWERKVRTYIDGRLSQSDLRRFQEHRRFCQNCDAAAESAEEALGKWLTDWERIIGLPPPPQS